MLTVFVASDATGETAERVVRSALVQFASAPASIERRGHIRTVEQIQGLVTEASATHSLIVHTLVSDDLRHRMLAEARRRGVDSMDLMGPILDRLATHMNLTPQEKPGLFKQLADARTREIESVEFAFRHDDGQRPEDLGRAEVVLVGVSRTMKTPTTLYLAYRGWFAANVPIIPEIPLPEILPTLPPERVICMVMAPERLQQLRLARAEYLKIPGESYTSLSDVRREVRHARKVARAYGWREVDVTSKSVEEVAQEVVTLLPAQERSA